MNKEKTLIIIPAFNEEDSLHSVVQQVFQMLSSVDVLVVNDGSTDQTGRVAHSSGAIVVSHPCNLGYGAALQTGFKFALKHGYTLVAHLDGDGQHPPDALVSLLKVVEAQEADVAIGSRFLNSNSYEMPFVRRMGSRFFAGLATWVTGQRVTDPTSGMQALNIEAVRFYASHIYPHDYPDADILITLHRTGFQFQEVPVQMLAPINGRSMHQGLKPIYYVFKMSLSILVSLLRRDLRPGQVYAASPADLRAHS